jgi:hypothetical protein
MEKAQRDLSRLTKKIIQNKSGHRQTVYVKMGLPMKRKDSKVGDETGIVVEDNREKALPIHILKKECFEYAREHFQGKKIHQPGNRKGNNRFQRRLGGVENQVKIP